MEAEVIFEEVHAPPGEGAGVLPLMSIAAGIAAAGQVAAAGVEAELQPLSMDIIGQVWNAVGKFLRVGDQAAFRVAFFQGPHIVDDDVFIARVAQAGIDHGVGGFKDQRLVDVGAEGIPGVPAHGRLSDEHSVLLGAVKRPDGVGME